ncbi:MAG: SAM-dependent methyltransferase, partial [Gammaproteobacteria bacterium]|nr:SAM-dependent methyltransferase [Gammaproteobacteria bacterium]
MSKPFPPIHAVSTVSQLPLPDADASRHSECLLRQVHDEIECSGGVLPFDRYMDLVLYAPGLGYYAAGSQKFGEHGDFITAPEVSPLFARCLAQQAAQVLDEIPSGDIIEFGAGSGLLAADLLLELELLGKLPRRYQILEVSPDLRQRQAETLLTKAPSLLSRVEWLENLPDEPFRGIALANELLDAFPVQRFRIEGGEVLEQFVAAAGSGLQTVWERVQS